ncbi:MAG: DUF3285 domain-containing protein [Cyanobacteria bacterium P01_D01_bin.73]
MASSDPQSSDRDQSNSPTVQNSQPEPPPSDIKLAMRNMVKKGSKSLQHFGLTVAALLGVLVGLAYLTR